MTNKNYSTQSKDMMNAAQELDVFIQNNDNLPDWVGAKLTKAIHWLKRSTEMLKEQQGKPIDKINIDDTKHKKTICEVHKEMYYIISTFPNNSNKVILMEKLQEAFLMAKKMTIRLHKHKFNHSDDWYEKQYEAIHYEKITSKNVNLDW